ncbi:MAG: DUF1573 domain-containing protein [Bacteroidales bacterium]
MKNIFWFFFAVFLGMGVAVSQEKKDGPELKWELNRYDYGTVYLDDLPETKLDIKFTNEGNEPLVLSHVRACCGTRVNSWPREPIMPGEESTIQIEFRLAPRAQRISRTLTVTSNADPATSIFRVVGEVVER